MTDRYIKTATDITQIIPIQGASIKPQKDNIETELMAELNLLESKYLRELRKKAREEFNEKKSDFEMPSVLEIEKNAVAEVDKIYDNKEASLEENYQNTLSKLESDIRGVELSEAEKDYNFKNSKYQKERELYESIAKKGLSHSTIGSLAKEHFESNKTKEYQFILEEVKIKKQKIDNELIDAKSKYEIALEGYEIAKAAELKKKIIELTHEAEKEAKAAAEINERIEQEEKSYFDAFSQMLMENEQMDREKGGYEGYKKSNYEERYEVAKKFYSNLDKKTALKLIEKNSILKDKLGIYYEKLINTIKGE